MCAENTYGNGKMKNNVSMYEKPVLPESVRTHILNLASF